MAKPNYQELLRRRVEADARPTFTVRVCLVPSLESELRELRAKPAGRRSIAETDDAHAAQLVDLETQISAATLVVTLKALSVADSVAARASNDGLVPNGVQWQADLKQAFVKAENADGALVEDVGRDEWAKLLTVMTATQLEMWHGQLGQAGAPIDFPTFAKS